MARPRIPWLERDSTNRDSVLLLLVGVGLPLLLGALDLAGVFSTMPLGAWIAVTVGVLLTPAAYRLGCRRTAATVPVDFDRYTEHVQDALQTLQLALSLEIPDLDMEAFVREGVLEPAAMIFSQRERGDVRFSVLAPISEDAEHFEMREALGHSPESRRKFRLRIAGSFAGLAYHGGRPLMSNDTDEDDRFTPHPKARQGREYQSIIAAPIPQGHEPVAVLVVVASKADAFADVDVAYVAQLGVVIGVVNAIVSPAGDG